MAKTDQKMEKNMAKMDKRMDEKMVKMDKKMEENMAKMDQKMEKNMAEMDKRIDEKIKKNNVELVTSLLKEIPTKDDMNQAIRDAKEEILADVRGRITAVQESIILFEKRWRYDVPDMVKVRLDTYEERIAFLESRIDRGG